MDSIQSLLDSAQGALNQAQKSWEQVTTAVSGINGPLQFIAAAAVIAALAGGAIFAYNNFMN